ncbi:hypothetical protein HK405_013999, partial [Cladochytrium tenue]
MLQQQQGVFYTPSPTPSSMLRDYDDDASDSDADAAISNLKRQTPPAAQSPAPPQNVRPQSPMRFPLAMSTGLTALPQSGDIADPAADRGRESSNGGSNTSDSKHLRLRGRSLGPARLAWAPSDGSSRGSSKSHQRRGKSIGPAAFLDKMADLTSSEAWAAHAATPPPSAAARAGGAGGAPPRVSLEFPTLAVRVVAVEEAAAPNSMKRPTRCLRLAVRPLDAPADAPPRFVYVRHRLRAKLDSWKLAILTATERAVGGAASASAPLP